jgi:hypothetical protein
MTKEEKKLVSRMNEVRDLLKEFGLTLHGYDPGVSVYWTLTRDVSLCLGFGPDEWKWLEPLLKELHLRRREAMGRG